MALRGQRFVATLLMLLLTGYAHAEGLAMFVADVGTGYSLFPGDAGNWRMRVNENSGVSASERVNVALSDQYFGLKFASKDRRGDRVFLASAVPTDLTPYVDAENALVCLIKSDRAPKRQAALRMGCGHPCAGNADNTKVLQALPGGEWQRLRVDLQCSTTKGLDAVRVDPPFLLLTQGRRKLDVADIRLVKGMREKAAIRC